MDPAHLALQFADRVLIDGVEGQIGAEIEGELQLVLVNVDPNNMQAHRLGVLHGHMTESAYAGDRDPIAWFGLQFLETL